MNENEHEYARDDFDEFDDDEYCDQENDMKYVLTAYLTFTLLAPFSGNSFLDTLRTIVAIAMSVYLFCKCDD